MPPVQRDDPYPGYSFEVIALGVAPDWELLGLSTLSAFVILVFGFHLFKRLEREFADVV